MPSGPVHCYQENNNFSETPPSDVHIEFIGQNWVSWPTIESLERLAREPRKVDILTGHIIVPKLASVRKEEREDIEWAISRIFHKPAFPTILWTGLLGYIIKISDSVCPQWSHHFPSTMVSLPVGFFYYSEMRNHWPRLLKQEALTLVSIQPYPINISLCRFFSVHFLFSLTVIVSVQVIISCALPHIPKETFALF